MNRTCKIKGHKMADTILYIPGREIDGEYVNYEWVCGRCGHSEFVKYGTKPDSFGPRINKTVKAGPVSVNVKI